MCPDAIKIHRELKRMRVGFQFALQNFDDTPTGVLMFQIFAAFAEYECKIIAERTHDGRKKRILGIGGNRTASRACKGRRSTDTTRRTAYRSRMRRRAPVRAFFLRGALEGIHGLPKSRGAERGRAPHTPAPWRDTTVSKNLRRAHNYAGVYRHRHGIEAATKAHREAVKLMGSDAPALDLSMVETIETEAYPPLITREEA